MDDRSDSVFLALWQHPTEAEKSRAIEAMVAGLRSIKERMERDVVPESCPSCGSASLARIYYVRIPPGSMMREAAKGRIVIDRAENGPSGASTVQCRACGGRSGSRAE